jgi:site-specific DNA recombinase
MNITGKQKCVIYCRVSSQRQMNEGHGLDSQEQRCRQYALSKNYEIVDVFRDEAISGKEYDRPDLARLLDFLEKDKYNSYVVIIDDLSRLARDIVTHSLIKQEFDKFNAVLESPNFNFDATPEGTLHENINASFAQYEREKKPQTGNTETKSQARNGLLVFLQPTRIKIH